MAVQKILTYKLKYFSSKNLLEFKMLLFPQSLLTNTKTEAITIIFLFSIMTNYFCTWLKKRLMIFIVLLIFLNYKSIKWKKCSFPVKQNIAEKVKHMDL